MAKPRGHIEVTNEVGFCSFCGRSRNLRREEHQLGDMVRTIVTCESCHRNLVVTMNAAGAQPSEPAGKEAEASAPAVQAEPEPVKPSTAAPSETPERRTSKSK